MDASQLNRRSKGHGLNGMNTSLYKPPSRRRHAGVTHAALRKRYTCVTDVPAFFQEEAARVKQLREAQAIARRGSR